jgi:uncharacterized membrane protein YkgB
VTSLLPQTIQQAVEHRTTYAASQSFGVVVLVVLLLLLTESQAHQLARVSPAQRAILAVLSAPLLIVFFAVAAARLLPLLN